MSSLFRSATASSPHEIGQPLAVPDLGGQLPGMAGLRPTRDAEEPLARGVAFRECILHCARLALDLRPDGQFIPGVLPCRFGLEPHRPMLEDGLLERRHPPSFERHGRGRLVMIRKAPIELARQISGLAGELDLLLVMLPPCLVRGRTRRPVGGLSRRLHVLEHPPGFGGARGVEGVPPVASAVADPTGVVARPTGGEVTISSSPAAASRLRSRGNPPDEVRLRGWERWRRERRVMFICGGYAESDGSCS
ncbi:MAG: hypothetical protein M5U12_08390 [Verrucomicrobia bacterium]|nr:hypothetical protein [Verrucomicrobiota bacterium]